MSFAKRRKKIPSNFKIQITSMVDMFVILLVFLIKSYSTDPVQITPSDDIRLPSSVSTASPIEILKVMVSQTGLFVEDVKVLDLVDGKFLPADIDKSDTNYIPSLFKHLDEQAKKTHDIAKVNATLEFEGKVLVQADKNLEYQMLKKIMHTSAVAGYSDIKFAVLGPD